MFSYLNTFAKTKEVVLKFDDFYISITRRFDSWEYWVGDINKEDNIDEGVYEASFAPMTQIIKELMEKHHLSPKNFELVVPDPYAMIDFIY